MRIIFSFSLINLLLILNGCSSLHLYNENSDTTAKAAATDYEAAKISERLKGQRAVLMELEEREVQAFRKLTLAQRDQELLALVSRFTPNQEPGATRPPARRSIHGFASRALKTVDRRLFSLDGDPDARAAVQKEEYKDRIALSRLQQIEKNARSSLASYPGLDSLPACNDSIAQLKDDKTGDALKTLARKDSYDPRFWESVSVFVNTLGQACADELTLNKKIANAEVVVGSQLASALTAYENQKKESIDRSNSAETAKIAMNDAAEALAKATKDKQVAEKMKDFRCATVDREDAVNGPKTLTTASVSENGTTNEQSKLCDAINTLDRLGSVGKKILAEEKIEKIGNILQALSGITPPPPEGKEVDKSVALIAATTRLAHSLRIYRQANKLPALEPLIIEKQLAEAQLASASARVALENKRLGLRAEIVDAIRQEIYVLGEARSNLFDPVYGGEAVVKADVECNKKNAMACSSYEDLLRYKEPKTGDPLERPAYRALTLYSEAYAARDRQMSARVRLELSGYQESLILSEEAMSSWKAVLDTPIDLLRQYHAGGIKPSDIAPILQTLGIFTIAGRIN